MDIARPPQGFTISLSDTVIHMVATRVETVPDFERYWGDIVERLKFTAHREGEPEPRLGRGFRLLVFSGDGIPARPRVVLGYRVLGDTVSIKLLRISEL